MLTSFAGALVLAGIAVYLVWGVILAINPAFDEIEKADSDWQESNWICRTILVFVVFLRSLTNILYWPIHLEEFYEWFNCGSRLRWILYSVCVLTILFVMFAVDRFFSSSQSLFFVVFLGITSAVLSFTGFVSFFNHNNMTKNRGGPR